MCQKIVNYIVDRVETAMSEHIGSKPLDLGSWGARLNRRMNTTVVVIVFMCICVRK